MVGRSFWQVELRSHHRLRSCKAHTAIPTELESICGICPFLSCKSTTSPFSLALCSQQQTVAVSSLLQKLPLYANQFSASLYSNTLKIPLEAASYSQFGAGNTSFSKRGHFSSVYNT
ncbi:hypothetical protein XENOCAPTIV_008033 [Xenoophorus captivus]|uniref:Uncharacterized protein n=1 Tax=Xenoophorus captivus TaxID=1517983 RepID=A0ABV0QQJ9_9TELE